MSNPVPQKTFQGFRLGDTELQSASVLLRDISYSSAQTETLEIILKPNKCTINLAGLSSAFRKYWKLKAISVSSARSAKPVSIEISPYAHEAASFTILGLNSESGRTYRGYTEEWDTPISDDFLYTAYFAKKRLDAPLPCLSLTNDNNLAFIFPFEGKSAPQVLWANKAMLAAASSYFASMLSGGFAETGKPLMRTSNIMGALQQDLADIAAAERAEDGESDHFGDDSDDEAPAGHCEESAWAVVDRGSKTAPSSLLYVVIRDTPYRTYRSLFQWLLTGEISFSQLRSSTASADEPSR